MIQYLTSSQFFFFFTATATPQIYTLSYTTLFRSTHTPSSAHPSEGRSTGSPPHSATHTPAPASASRSEEHTSELQSRPHLVCRLLLEKKKTISTPLGVNAVETAAAAF